MNAVLDIDTTDKFHCMYQCFN